MAGSLFPYTRLEKGSPEKDKYGCLERGNRQYHLKLNLKIVFLKYSPIHGLLFRPGKRLGRHTAFRSDKPAGYGLADKGTGRPYKVSAVGRLFYHRILA